MWHNATSYVAVIIHSNGRADEVNEEDAVSAIGPKRTSLVALHMSAIGPKRTSLVALHMSAIGP